MCDAVGEELSTAVRNAAPEGFYGSLKEDIDWKSIPVATDAIVEIGVHGSEDDSDQKTKAWQYVNYVINGTEEYSIDGLMGPARDLGDIWFTHRAGQAPNDFHVRALMAMKDTILAYTAELLGMDFKWNI